MRRAAVRLVALGGRADPAGERTGRGRRAALGFNVTKHKIAAFCVSALFSGTAGAMLIFYMGTASVNTVVDLAIAFRSSSLRCWAGGALSSAPRSAPCS